MSRAVVVRIAIMLAVGGALGAAFYYAPAYFRKEPPPPPQAQLKMGGSSVVFFIMDKWKAAYRKKGIELSYASTGSIKGISKVIDQEYDIGYTSAALTEKQQQRAKDKKGDVLHVPVTLIAVVPIYNVDELNDKPPLKFTGEVLAKIFLGKIDKWNDPELQALNQGTKLPDKKIQVVHRKDRSGTTLVFTDYLHGASSTWQKEMGPGKDEIKWPVGVGIERNYGVAGEVKRTEGTIGYVESLHAVSNKLAFGAVENKDKTGFLIAKPETVTAAAQGALGSVPAEVKLTNRPGKNAYPICAVDWAVFYQAQPVSKQKLVSEFLQWAIHDGQEYAGELHYAPLPADLVEAAEQTIKSIKAQP